MHLGITPIFTYRIDGAELRFLSLILPKVLLWLLEPWEVRGRLSEVGKSNVLV